MNNKKMTQELKKQGLPAKQDGKKIIISKKNTKK